MLCSCSEIFKLGDFVVNGNEVVLVESFVVILLVVVVVDAIVVGLTVTVLAFERNQNIT